MPIVAELSIGNRYAARPTLRAAGLSIGNRYAARLMPIVVELSIGNVTRPSCYWLSDAINRLPLRGPGSVRCRLLSIGEGYAVRLLRV